MFKRTRKQKERSMLLIALIFITPLCLVAQSIKWTEEFPGVWKGSFGKPDSYTLLSASGSKPKADALMNFTSTPFPLKKMDIQAKIVDGKTYLRFPLEKKEEIFGLGLNFQSVHQRGKIFNLHVDHYSGRDDGRTHAPVPFYVSTQKYGVFINSAQYMTFYVGTSVKKDSKNPPEVKDRNTDNTWTPRPYSDQVEVLIPAEGIEFYVFSGNSTLDVVRKFNLYCGGGSLPPRWGLGFSQRVHTLSTAENVIKETEEFEKRGYPLDLIGLEPGWQSKSYPCTFEWDKTRFPDPSGFTKKLLEKNIRLNLWTNPYVSPEASIQKAIEPYTSSHTVWCGIVPDLNHPEARNIMAQQFSKDQVKIGVSGYKIDEVDGGDNYLWPDVTTFPSGISATQMRQTYGVLAQTLVSDMYRKENLRTYGMVRGSNAGGNSLPYVIYNDNYNHRDYITGLVNSGFCGVLWTPEVRSSSNSEEWLRRFQSVVFSPMAIIDAWESGTKPWSFPEVAEQIKFYAELRMQLMPYFYSEFAKYHFEGTPPFRAMPLEDGFRNDSKTIAGSQNLAENPYLEAVNNEIKDQYMAGEYLLVAPMFAGQKSRKVLLPEGNWYDFYTGELVGNGQEITVKPGLDKIPVFVKDGGIIPMMEKRLHAPGASDRVKIEVRHYGKKVGTYQLYDDDGFSFDYERGNYSWRNIEVKKNKRGELTGSFAAPEKGKPNTVKEISFHFMTK